MLTKRHLDKAARMRRIYGASWQEEPPAGKPIPKEFKIRLFKKKKMGAKAKRKKKP